MTKGRKKQTDALDIVYRRFYTTPQRRKALAEARARAASKVVDKSRTEIELNEPSLDETIIMILLEKGSSMPYGALRREAKTRTRKNDLVMVDMAILRLVRDGRVKILSGMVSFPASAP